MSPEWVSILALLALFVVGTVLPINMGALGFVAAWLVGMFSLGMSDKEIVGGMSADLVLTLVGVTYLFAIAKNNGTVDLIVHGALTLVRGRISLIPWVMFGITALLTAIGAASPAACAIIGPIALGFAGRYGINPLLMGMFVVHGAQAGGFSPISIYGAITNGVMRSSGLPVGEGLIFAVSFVVNLLIAVALYLVLGRGLRDRSREARAELEAETHVDAASLPSPGGGTGVSTDTLVSPQTRVEARARTAQYVTLVMFAAVALLSLVFDKNIGFTSITGAVLLTALYPAQQKGAIAQIAWATVLLVAGVSCFAAVLEEAGAPEYVGTWAASFSTALVGALLLCYVGGVVSAFASSTALLPIIIPIAIPLIQTGGINPITFAAALGVASTIVDVSPFSTNGALMVANRPDTISEERYYRQVLGYAVIVTLVGPLLVWAAVVLPGW